MWLSPSRQGVIKRMFYGVQEVESVKSSNKTFKADLFIFEVKKCSVLWPTKWVRFQSLPRFPTRIISTRRHIICRLSNENISFKSLKYSSTYNNSKLLFIKLCFNMHREVLGSEKSAVSLFLLPSTLHHKIFRNKNP